MIIKDLWIIKTTGGVVYHYKASFSDYDIDQEMFGGFIAALATFGESLTQKQVRFLKLKGDELYFQVLGQVIVVSIMSSAGAEQNVIDQMLLYVGERFVEEYEKNLGDEFFEWSAIEEAFSGEIEYITADASIYEEMKREMINRLLNDILHGTVPPDILAWKVGALFSDSTDEEIDKTIELVDGLLNILPSLKHNPVMENKITGAFKAARQQLQLKKMRSKNQLFVLCTQDELYEKIFRNFLTFGTLSMQFKTFDQLLAGVQSIKNHHKELYYNVMILDYELSSKEVQNLASSVPKGKIFVWEDLLPSGVEDDHLGDQFNVSPGFCSFEHACPKIFDIINSIQLTNQPTSVQT